MLKIWQLRQQRFQTFSAQAVLFRVSRAVQFQQYFDMSIELSCGSVDRLEKTQTIDTVDERDQRQGALDFVPLQMSDLMPMRTGQALLFGLFPQLLRRALN